MVLGCVNSRSRDLFIPRKGSIDAQGHIQFLSYHINHTRLLWEEKELFPIQMRKCGAKFYYFVDPGQEIHQWNV